MCYEDQKYTLPAQPQGYLTTDSQTILGNSTAAQYISGIAFHWYQKNVSAMWHDDAWCKQALSELGTGLETNNMSDIFLFATEACQGCAPQTPQGPTTDSNTQWRRAEEYGHDIIADLNYGTIGWTDWNLALNTDGGPNHANNLWV